MSHIIHLFKDKEGITVMEYGLISFVISLAAITAIVSLECHLVTLFPV